jgi:hypothetical protein
MPSFDDRCAWLHDANLSAYGYEEEHTAIFFHLQNREYARLA